MAKNDRPSGLRSIGQAMGSWRTASVSLLSFASGLPLGLVWIAVPDWMRKEGVDLRVVGLFTLAQAPWTFKFLWSPLMDRYVPPFLGRRRGWALLAQIAIALLTFSLAGVGDHPEAPWVVGAICFAIALASATQDIAVDAYTVDVLRPEEQGVAVGARIALYRLAMVVAGGMSIWLASLWSWPAVNAGLAALFIPIAFVTIFAPEPEEKVVPPRTLREAVWLPFLGFLSKHRALEILAFVVCYKLADNLAQALLRPFLFDMGYGEFDRGFMLAVVGVFVMVAGTFFGATLTTTLGLGHCLWAFGFLQILSNVGYIFVAQSPVNRPLMYSAMAFENVTTGMGMGAFSVLLLRLTQKRFSATQYALFSSLFGLPRIFSGPIAGYFAYELGWASFFWATIVAGIPGLILLARFVPIGVRDPVFELAATPTGPPLSRAAIVVRGVVGSVAGAAIGALAVAALAGLKALRANREAGFDLMEPLRKLVQPSDLEGWITLAGVVVFALVCGLLTAAVAAARHGNAGIGAAIPEANQ